MNRDVTAHIQSGDLGSADKGNHLIILINILYIYIIHDVDLMFFLTSWARSETLPRVAQSHKVVILVTVYSGTISQGGHSFYSLQFYNLFTVGNETVVMHARVNYGDECSEA